MSHTEIMERSLIPLSSIEALWEWHIPSDTLYLSQGACHKLGLPGVPIPTTMTAFLAHVPSHYMAELRELHESALNGVNGSFLETTYPFDTFFVRERMFILGRDTHGRANWAMGQYVVSPGVFTPPATVLEVAQERTGFWLYSSETRTIHADARCAAMLGYSALPRVFSWGDWHQHLHGKALEEAYHRHQFVLEQSLMGDTIEDTITLDLADGKSLRLVLRGSVLDRDADGKALHVAGTLQSIEATKAVKEQQQENGRLLFALNATGDGLWDWDAQTDSVYYSPRYLSMLGYTGNDFPGRLDDWKEKIHPDDRDKIVLPQQAIVDSARYGDTFECTYRLQRADGSWAWILGRGYVTHRDATGRATRIVGMHTDVTTLQNGREQLEDLVKNDALTGLRSRAYCDMELERIEREHIRPISIIACDICGLKMINDSMGHAVGDKLLNKAAMMLRHPLRATDCVARTGGDEFIILLPGCPKEQAEKILQQIKQHFEGHNNAAHDMPVLVSFGLASSNDPALPISRLLAEADRYMLCDKQTHRKLTHRHIKNWIERNAQIYVSLEDSRYES